MGASERNRWADDGRTCGVYSTGLMLDLQEAHRRLAAIRSELFERYPLRSLAIFGSYARGEQRPESDVDVLVEFREPVGFEVADLAMELEAALGRPVDLVTRGALGARRLAHVERDLVHV